MLRKSTPWGPWNRGLRLQKVLEETEALTESLEGVTEVHGRYYQLCSDYHQVMGNHKGYYQDALRFLGCTPLDKIPRECSEGDACLRRTSPVWA